MLDLLALLGAPDIQTESESERDVPLRRLPPRTALFHEGAAADAIYVVRAGTFKCCRTDADGGEQVLGFARRGDVLGYAAVGLGRYTSSAFALEAASVGVVPLADLFNRLRSRPALDRALHQALSLQQAGFEELAGVRAAVPAEARLARFLLHWAQRMAMSGHSLRQIKLTVNRRDIGRLLGIAPETVSRAFAALSVRGCIAVKGRMLDMLDTDGLHVIARFRAGNARPAPDRSWATPRSFAGLNA
ncbi:MAG: hypothetical protein C0443_15335 [Comamonadaceae bacterium]|nr:hypothetical protein [Comamonadaceae bacterium]